MAPVKKVPPVTTTSPPPARLQSSIALRNASVQTVTPSPTAPYFVTENLWCENFGGTMRERMPGTCAQAFSADSLPVEPDAQVLRVHTKVNAKNKWRMEVLLFSSAVNGLSASSSLIPLQCEMKIRNYRKIVIAQIMP